MLRHSQTVETSAIFYRVHMGEESFPALNPLQCLGAAII